MSLKEYLSHRIQLVDSYLDRQLRIASTFPEIIHQAMRYSVFAGGKRIRPVLVIAACEAMGGEKEKALPAAGAIELIHTYSLIHDDLPAMDNDDYRRGQPTSHKVYGEAMAILAGDGLLTYAFEMIVNSTETDGDSAKALAVIREISEAAGTTGMIGGQVVDMVSENKEISLDTLNYIHHHKTGALFKAAVRTGAILAGASGTELAALTNYAFCLGQAFQITDDILDIEGEAELLGKSIGSDQKNNKATYPSLVGLEKSKKIAREYAEQAKKSIIFLGHQGRYLDEILTYLLARKS